jgi:UbiD family decarboxylase
MSVYDLREHLKKLDAIGQLKTLDGVPLKYVVGAVTDMNAKNSGGTLLFDKFEGYEPGYCVMVGSMCNSKTMATVFGFDGEYNKLELADKIAEVVGKLDETQKDFPMEVVKDGPIFENQLFDDDVDLYKIPVPIWHEDDGGPYIGTGCFQVHQDPDSGWVNCGTYRAMQHDKNRVGNYISPGHHGDIIRRKYWEKGKPAPVAYVVGAHPLFYMLGSTDVPLNVNEYNWAGAITGQRVPVVKLPKTGLPVPAEAEIVLEGYAYPDSRCLEGPFGEFTGYYGGGVREEYFVQITGMYFRNHPILLGSPPGPLPNDMSFQFSVMRSANVKAALIRAGIPGVKAVWAAESGGGRLWLVTSIKQQFAGHASMAAHIAGQCPQGGLINKWSIVVDDDIDPSNMEQVIWAISTRVEPNHDIDIVNDCWSNPLEPMLPNEDKSLGKMATSKAVVKATIPYDRIEKNKKNLFPPTVKCSDKLLDKVKVEYGSLWK